MPGECLECNEQTEEQSVMRETRGSDMHLQFSYFGRRVSERYMCLILAGGNSPSIAGWIV